MRVAICHYHLRTGGVTRIIAHAARALGAAGIGVVVLSGEAPALPWSVPVRVVPGLGYDGGGSAEGLARSMAAAAADALGGPPDLWHVHNHSLGKNLLLPPALHALAAAGGRLLLQIHDFPEDGRPRNYRRLLHELGGGDAAALARVLYPYAPQVVYAALNRRDQGVLVAAGAEARLLPNPVWLPPRVAEVPVQAGLWLYPTRAIRRKNLGELLLWAAVAPAGRRYATTLGPENPAEQPRYRAWVDLAGELSLPVAFELGAGPGTRFEELVAAAECLVTTSVAEGFGMAFLEPWLLGRPVAGRDLPEVTGEFREAGIELDHLYRRLEVPVAWPGRDRLAAAAGAALEALFEGYGRRPAADAVECALAAWIRDERVDYGRLDEPLQARILRRLAAQPADRLALEPAALPEPADPGTLVARNRRVILEHYGLEDYGRRLLALYRELAGREPGPQGALDAGVILDTFLDPARLHLLRT